MSTAPGVNSELVAAVREMAALYGRLPEAYRPDLTGEPWDRLEREIDERCGAGDREGALLGVREWQRHAERVLTAALHYAPAEDEDAV